MTSADGTSARVDFAGIHALASRGAGYAVALKCLEVQADAETRDPSLRTARGVNLHTDAWPWYAGALGEMEVGRLLTVLGPEWFVRHSVPIGAGTKDVDHLVIGPGGVFAINTKHHRDASVWVGDHVLRVNNANTPHLKIGHGDGVDVSRRLGAKVGFPVPVRSVIAVLNAKSIVDRRSPNDRPVSVVDAKRLAAWLARQPQQLNAGKLGLLKLAAEEPETWHIDPRAADTLRVMQRFERLVAQVGTRPAAPTPRSRVAVPRAPAGRRSKRSVRSKKSSPIGIVGLWVWVAFLVAAVTILNGIASAPCASPAACMLPTLITPLRPLLGLVVILAIGSGVIGSLAWLVRRKGREARRRP
jgi:hypothetical protein